MMIIQNSKCLTYPDKVGNEIPDFMLGNPMGIDIQPNLVKVLSYLLYNLIGYNCICRFSLALLQINFKGKCEFSSRQCSFLSCYEPIYFLGI